MKQKQGGKPTRNQKLHAEKWVELCNAIDQPPTVSPKELYAVIADRGAQGLKQSIEAQMAGRAYWGKPDA